MSRQLFWFFWCIYWYILWGMNFDIGVEFQGGTPLVSRDRMEKIFGETFRAICLISEIRTFENDISMGMRAIGKLCVTERITLKEIEESFISNLEKNELALGVQEQYHLDLLPIISVYSLDLRNFKNSLFIYFLFVSKGPWEFLRPYMKDLFKLLCQKTTHFFVVFCFVFSPTKCIIFRNNQTFVFS